MHIVHTTQSIGRRVKQGRFCLRVEEGLRHIGLGRPLVVVPLRIEYRDRPSL